MPQDHSDRARADEADDGPTPDERQATELALRIERIAVLSDALRASRADARRLERELDATTRTLERLRSRPIVRFSRAVAAVLRAVPILGRRTDPTPIGDPAVAPTPGPNEVRADLLMAIDGPGFVADSRRFRVAAIDLGDAWTAAVRALGWDIVDGTADDEGVDAVVVTDPTFDVRTAVPGAARIALVPGDPTGWLGRPWTDEYDLVLTLDEDAGRAFTHGSVHRPVVIGTIESGAGERLRAAVRRWVAAPRLDLAIGPPTWDVATTWGDYHLGRALQRGLIAKGLPTRIRLRPDWSASDAGRSDAVIHLHGLVERPLRSDQLNVLWIISHPDRITDDYVRRHDVVFAASDSYSAMLSTRTGRVIHALHQATDPARFRPVPGGRHHELLFVANSRGARRPIVDELTPTTRDMAVYGQGWSDDRIDQRFVRDTHIPNEELAAAYAAATIVLNDHWADMAAHGFLSNRLYDAAASGAFVISDYVQGIESEFDGGIATFRTGTELRHLVDRFVTDPAARASRAQRALDAVQARHTIAHRVDQLLDVIEPPLRERVGAVPTGSA